jgi:FkbM family methyltransferase
MKKAIIVIFDVFSEKATGNACHTASRLSSEYETSLLLWNGLESLETSVKRRLMGFFEKRIYGLTEDKKGVFEVIKTLNPELIHFSDTPELFVEKGILAGIHSDKTLKVSEYMFRKDFDCKQKKEIPSKFIFSDEEVLRNMLPVTLDFDMEADWDKKTERMKGSYNGRLGMVVTFYKTNYNTYELLYKTIKSLCFEDWFIVLATHSAVPENIQEMCDLVIFESENIADQRRFSHGVAETSLIRKSLNALREMGIEWTFKICYDTDLNDLSAIKGWVKDYYYDFVSCKWGEKDVSTNSFFANVGFTLDTFSYFESIESMFQRSCFIEDVWDQDAKTKGVSDRIFTYQSKEEMFGSNTMDTESFSYDKVDFRFEESQKTFYVDNNGETPLAGKFSIVDYYSDLAIFLDDSFVGTGGIWIMPNPVFLNNDLPKNGYYLEVSDNEGNVILRRNVGIRDYRFKHKLHRIHNGIRRGMSKYCKDTKYPELVSFDRLKLYDKFGLSRRKVETFIDAGAHAGMFTLAMIESGAKKGYVIEPEPHAYDILKENLETNWLMVIDKALYKENCKVEFNIFSEFETTNSIDPNWQANIKERIQVDAVTVDEFFRRYVKEDRIDLFKIDIEGGEYDAFRGMSDETMNRCGSFLIEFHSNKNFRVMELVERLVKNGFSLAFDKYHEHDNDNYMLNDMGIIFAYK